MSNETKWTDASWRYQRHHKPISGTCYHEIYTDRGNEAFDDLIGHAASEPIANLIAVAPTMYKFLDDLAHGRGTDYPIEKLLAKARGEQ